MATAPLMWSLAISRIGGLLLALFWSGVMLLMSVGERLPQASIFAYTRGVAGQTDLMLGDALGRVVRLTQTPFREGQPTWSPDGTQIAYVTTEKGILQINRMSAYGDDPVTVMTFNTSVLSPYWFSDGERLAYAFEREAEGNAFDIFTMNLAENAHRNVTDTNLNSADPIVSASGDYIAYIHNGSEVRVGALPYGDIVWEGTIATGDPAWSPVDDQIAYVGPRDQFVVSVIDTIYIRDMNDVDSPRIYSFDSITDVGDVAWLPDGTALVFVGENSGIVPLHRSRLLPKQVFYLDLTTGEATPLTDHPGLAMSPSWSPDGSQVAFVLRDPPGPNTICLYTIATGKTACPYAFNGAVEGPFWRPTLK
jgi:Tol biopolymer transport system component